MVHINSFALYVNIKIGFVWSVNDQLWENNFEELRRHRAEHGTFEVTHKQNKKLAVFISRMRTAMKHKEEGHIQQECEFLMEIFLFATLFSVRLISSNT